MVSRMRLAPRSASTARGRFSAGFHCRGFFTPRFLAFTRTPARSRRTLLVFRAIRRAFPPARILFVDLAEQPLDAVPAVDRLVVGEVEIGDHPQAQGRAHFAAQPPAGRLDSPGRLLADLDLP